MPISEGLCPSRAALISAAQIMLEGDSESRRRCISLLAHLLQISELELRTDMKALVLTEIEQRFWSGIERLRSGEPDAYVQGQNYFFGYPIELGPGVLIPRPDSELLVLTSLKYLKEMSSKLNRPLRVLELCTGSGCLSLALASEWQATTQKPLSIHATEISEEALRFAKKNLSKLILEERVILEKADLWPSVNEKFDLIMANPPYISESEFETLDASVKDYEPSLALLAGADGLDFYRRILHEADSFLHEGGFLVLEHGFQQGASLVELAKGTRFVHLALLQDYGARDRVTVFMFMAKESEYEGGQ